MQLYQNHIAIIGLGNIGRILLQRLQEAMVPMANIIVCDTDPHRRESISAEFGVNAASPDNDTACEAILILITTPPETVLDILQSISPKLQPGQTVVSFAATVPLAKLEVLVPTGVAVARVLPNAPSLVGEGMNLVAYGAGVTPDARALLEKLLELMGEHLDVQDEQIQGAVGLTATGMRSLLPVLEGMTAAGVKAGFSEEDARQMAAQVMLGTAALALQTDLAFDEIKSLTPIETLDETAVAKIFHEAARGVKVEVEDTRLNL